jgi:UDP-glucuronate 4-epimerase
MRVFITGTAGFIGFHLARRLLEQGHEVVGFDGVTDYYDPQLKRARLALLGAFGSFTPVEGMLEDVERLRRAVALADAEVVVHLAAQAGVRYSLEAPQSYIQSNIVGTANLLEALRHNKPRHLIFASTSSVYGGNSRTPFAETDRADSPMSLYAATKKSGEAMVHSYAHLFGIPSTCVRFFTVYGSWSRPDMAPIKFLSAMQDGRFIDVYGHGQLRRDFTFVDDLVAAIVALMPRIPALGQSHGNDSLSPVAPFRVVNIGGGTPTLLLDFIGELERASGLKARLNLLPIQPGEVVATESDTRLLQALVRKMPETPLATGLRSFVDWYRSYYN